MPQIGYAHRQAPMGRDGMVASCHPLASLAGVGAAAASGFVAPELAGEALAAEPAAREGWNQLLEYNHMLNQAFASVLVVGSSAAIALWSAEIVRSRVLARGRRALAGEPNLQAENPVRVVVRRRGEIAGDHEELPELLFERHAREEIADARVDGQVGALVRRRRLRGRLHDDRGDADEKSGEPARHCRGAGAILQ